MERSRKATAEQAMQMEKTRKANFKPVVVPFATHNLVGTFHFIALENIGEGIAKNLHAEWHIKGIEGSEREYDKPTYQPSERRIFGLPLEAGKSADKSLEKIKEVLEGTSEKLIVNISYQGVLDTSYNDHYEIDIVEQLEGRIDSDEMQSGDLNYSNLGRYEAPPSGDGHDM